MCKHVISTLKTPINLTITTSNITDVSIQKIFEKVMKIEEVVNWKTGLNETCIYTGVF